MNIKTNTYLLYALSLAGFLFSGYLSGIKLFTNTCAFGETCPSFLGYPACYFGFALFLILFVNSCALVFKRTLTINISIVTSAIGILFAGRFVIQEIVKYVNSGFEWSALGFPTCTYGLIFFILIFFVSRSIKMNK
jgi:hypothetical protein